GMREKSGNSVGHCSCTLKRDRMRGSSPTRIRTTEIVIKRLGMAADLSKQNRLRPRDVAGAPFYRSGAELRSVPCCRVAGTLPFALFAPPIDAKMARAPIPLLDPLFDAAIRDRSIWKLAVHVALPLGLTYQESLFLRRLHANDASRRRDRGD